MYVCVCVLLLLLRKSGGIIAKWWGNFLDLLGDGEALEPGVYKMVFQTGEYYKGLNTKTFYPEVTVMFETFDKTHYHVPLLLNPFGYSTYRGS